MRIIGMDIHRVAAEVVSLLEGEIVKHGRVQTLRNKLEEFARREVTRDDLVVIEATGNAAAVAKVLSPYVDRIVIANPKQVPPCEGENRYNRRNCPGQALRLGLPAGGLGT